MLGRENRLRSSAEFKAVYRGGRLYPGRLVMLYVFREGSGKKAGIVVSRRIGGAVKRNRVRRLIREAVRKHLPEIPEGIRMVLTARSGAAEAPFEAVQAEVTGLLVKAGLME